MSYQQKQFIEHEATIIENLNTLKGHDIWVANGMDYGIDHIKRGFAVEAFVQRNNSLVEIKLWFNEELGRVDSASMDLTSYFQVTETSAAINFLKCKLVELEQHGEIILQDMMMYGRTEKEFNDTKADIANDLAAIRHTIKLLGGTL